MLTIGERSRWLTDVYVDAVPACTCGGGSAVSRARRLLGALVTGASAAFALVAAAVFALVACGDSGSQAS